MYASMSLRRHLVAIGDGMYGLRWFVASPCVKWFPESGEPIFSGCGPEKVSKQNQCHR